MGTWTLTASAAVLGMVTLEVVVLVLLQAFRVTCLKRSSSEASILPSTILEQVTCISLRTNPLMTSLKSPRVKVMGA